MQDYKVHLVGSIPLDNAKTVFEEVGQRFGDRIYSIPDGETGERLNWMGWLEPIFANHNQFVGTGEKFSPREGSQELTEKYVLKPGVRPTEVKFDDLPFSDIAIQSYRDFERVKRAGKIAASVRFQVTLAGPISVIRRYVKNEAEQEEVMPAYQEALIREVEKIASVVPHHELAVQWDVASAVFERLERGDPTRFGQTRDQMLRSFVQAHLPLAAAVPDASHLQFHLCYGDAAHKHSIEPSSAQFLVDFANELSARVQRRIELIHMPVPRGRMDDAYYAPLQQLSLRPETKVVLGLVHLTDGIDGTRQRMRVAHKYLKKFAIATECGFGRRPHDTIMDLLEIHAELSGLNGATAT